MSERTTAMIERTTTTKSNLTEPKSETKGRSRAAEGVSAKPRSAAERESLIALAAYFRAERRGFVPGQELNDWLEAEQEIERQLSGG